ncbi:MAG: SAM-dependent methyltransferase, partial [Bacteroidota bacterium]|nr:SAM-dependent methyltransferase [Bacteroidota bacterium]
MKRNAPEPVQHPASFRDPSGFIVRAGTMYYRQVDQAGAQDYEQLMRSGLYDRLIARKLLIPHTEVDEDLTGSAKRYKTLLPRQLPFISYPSEWSPDQLRDIALHSLDVLELALDHGMILKDASPMNVQFDGGAPVFIDTLSFTSYDETRPWVAYRQFCECCLFPLYLHRYAGDGVHRIFAAYPAGIPAAVTARLLPAKSRLSSGVWMHVLLQSKIRSDGEPGGRTLSFSKEKLLRLVHHLRHIIKQMNLVGRAGTAWSGYYGEGQAMSGDGYLKAKEKLFLELTGEIEAATWLDLGANDGHFTRLLAGRLPAG